MIVRNILLALFCAAIGVSPAEAQKYRLDLTTTEAIANKPTTQEIVGVGAGIKAHSHQVPAKLPLELSVVSVEPSEIAIGSRITYEVSIKNVGTQPIAIPFSPRRFDLVDLQPDVQELTLRLTVPNTRGARQLLTAVSLHGSKLHSTTMIELQPGESANVKAYGWIAPPEDAGISTIPTEHELQFDVRLQRYPGEWTEPVVSVEPVKAVLRMQRPPEFRERP